MIKQTNDRKELLVLFATDSLANPRIWNTHEEDGGKRSLAVDFLDTYPMLVKRKIEESIYKKGVITNVYANRGSGYGMLVIRAADFFHFYFPKGNSADLTIFQAGISECWIKDDGKPRVSTEEFTENVKKIMDFKIRHDPNTPSIFLTIMPTTKKYLEKQPEQNKIISEWNQILKNNLADNCYIADIEKYFYENIDKQEIMVHPDGHHLNIDGHEIYAQIIIDTIYNISKENVKST